MYRPSALLRSAFAFTTLIAALCTALPVAAEAQTVMREVSPERMTAILTSMGLEAREASGAPEGEQAPLVVELGGYRALVFLLNDNTDAQLYIVFDEKVKTDRMNEWNRDHRFARAYRDEDGDAVLEADLDFAGGVTEDAIKAWVRLFRDMAMSYAEFVR